MNKKKEKPITKSKLDKKMKRFVENNFPPYNNMEVISNDKEQATLLLDYGSKEPKMKVVVDRAGGEIYSNFRLVETIFM